MRRLEHHMESNDHGKTVAEALMARDYSKRLIVALKQQPEGLLLNGVRVRSTAMLKAGDLLGVTLPDERPAARINDALAVSVLYEDDDLVVYDKPAGLVCHRSGSHIDDTLENAFGLGTFRAVFRLDRDTSGALLVAKHQMAAGRLWRGVEKRYLAVVAGRPFPDKGTIDLPLERERAYEPRQTVSPDGRPARTHYRVLRSTGDRSLLECRLETGRMHQIRAHLAAAGHPLLGDALYGGDLSSVSRQALHCAELSFFQPVTGERLRVISPIPEDFSQLL